MGIIFTTFLLRLLIVLLNWVALVFRDRWSLKHMVVSYSFKSHIEYVVALGMCIFTLLTVFEDHFHWLTQSILVRF